MARLKEKYREEIIPELMKEFGYSNVMQAPKLEKIVLNVGLGEAISNAKALESAVSVTVTAQRPANDRAAAASRAVAGPGPLGSIVASLQPRPSAVPARRRYTADPPLGS